MRAIPLSVCVQREFKELGGILAAAIVLLAIGTALPVTAQTQCTPL